MGRKVVINEDRLRILKEQVANSIESVSLDSHAHKVDEAAPEVDEYEIGDEGNNPPMGGNYYHINEGYCSSNLASIDLSDVGEVEYEWNFDEDDYNEWLLDNEFADSEEARKQYYTEELTYSVTYYDNETFHYMANDCNLTYDDLEELFGEDMAQKMLANCIEKGNGRFETIELYENETFDINNPQELDNIAMKLFSHGEYHKGCRGFILSNGVIIYTENEHNEVCIIPGIESKFQFIELGNIRLLPNAIDIGGEPTYEQEEVLRRVIASYSDDELYLDIFDKGEEIGAVYIHPNWRYVMGEINRYYSEGVRPQGSRNFYEGAISREAISENFDFEVNSSEIDLSSFRKKHELVPNIWKPNGSLDSRVRLKLLDIADDFWKYVNLSWVKPKGIILTGSICNFNWSQYSDIDLHLIADFAEVDEKTEFVKDYLDMKKNEWNSEHDKLEIMGYPVELYVQDVGEMPKSNGIYDLEGNKWLKEPNAKDIKQIGLNKFSIKDRTAKIMTIIDDMHDALTSTDDCHEIEVIANDADYLWKKIKDMRKNSLERNGENGNGNICYKYMRRVGYLDKLWRLRTLSYDKLNSI